MAVRDNFEAGGFRQAQGNPCRSIIDFDVFFRQKRKPHIHVSSAIVDLDLAACVLQRDVVLRPYAEVSRRVKDFKAARSGFHRTGELRKVSEALFGSATSRYKVSRESPVFASAGRTS